jgi:hypothetical protein
MTFCSIEACVARLGTKCGGLNPEGMFQACDDLLGAKSKVETRQEACECPVLSGG